MSERIEWEGTEAQQQQERMKACRERCAQWGEPDEGDDCDGDGSCAECEMDMAEALETEESRARRRASRAAASAPAGDGDVIAALIAWLDAQQATDDAVEHMERVGEQSREAIKLAIASGMGEYIIPGAPYDRAVNAILALQSPPTKAEE